MDYKHWKSLIILLLILALFCSRAGFMSKQLFALSDDFSTVFGNNPSKEVVSEIHPLIYSSFLDNDLNTNITALVVDDQGCAYVAGTIRHRSIGDFPVSRNNPGFQKDFPARPRTSGDLAGFVIKIDPSGTEILFSTYLGGFNRDFITSIAVDKHYHVYVTGYTTSSKNDKFPIGDGIPGYDTSFNGSADGFVIKLDSSGSSILYSTYLGGMHQDVPQKIKVNNEGEAFLCGRTLSNNFPWTDTPFNRHKGDEDVFVVRLSAEGTELIYSIAIGGEKKDRASDIAIDEENYAYIVGSTMSSPEDGFPVTEDTPGAIKNYLGAGKFFDAFVIKITPDGNKLEYASYVGGMKNDYGLAIAVDSTGHAYIAGYTQSSSSIGFPVGEPIPGFESKYKGIRDASDGFVLKLSPAGDQILFSTYIGGTKQDIVLELVLDKEENIFIGGITFSAPKDGFPVSPVVPGFFKDHKLGSDIFAIKLNNNGTELMYSTYFGAHYNDWLRCMAVDQDGYLYLAGRTFSSEFCGFPIGENIPAIKHQSKMTTVRQFISKLCIPYLELPEKISLSTDSMLLPIHNIGNGLLKCILTSSSDWLHFSNHHFHSNEALIELELLADLLADGEHHCMIKLYSNAGTYWIPLVLQKNIPTEAFGPYLEIIHPFAISSTHHETATIRGQITGSFDSSSIAVNGKVTKNLSLEGFFTHEVELQMGANFITLSAQAEGFTKSTTIRINREKPDLNREITIEMWLNNTEARVNGEIINTDATYMIQSGRSYLPLRFVSESLGAIVSYDETEKCATIKYETKYGPIVSKVFIDSMEMLINGSRLEPTMGLFVSNGRIIICPRFISHAFNAHVEYEARERKMTIQTSDSFSCY